MKQTHFVETTSISDLQDKVNIFLKKVGNAAVSVTYQIYTDDYDGKDTWYTAMIVFNA